MLSSVNRGTLSVLVAALALVAFAIPLHVAVGQPGPRATTPDVPPRVTSSSDAVLAKVHPRLRDALTAGREPARRAVIVVRSAPTTDLSRYVDMAGSTRWPLGQKLTIARVKLANVSKIASLPGVSMVEEFTDELTRVPLGDPDPEAVKPRLTLAERRARLDKLRAIDVPWFEAPRPLAQPFRAGSRLPHADSPSGWWDVGPGHRSRAAWDRGWRGEGVKVAVLDDSVDFVHPDLQGTWATIDITQSAYFGWLQAFDPWSVYVYAQEHALKERGDQTYGWLGGARYISTTQVSGVGQSWDDARSGQRVGRACFTPLYERYTTGPGGSRSPLGGKGFRPGGPRCDWVVPVRDAQGRFLSRSGSYRFGNHPDLWLSAVYGERVGVLLTDATVAGRYDTLYVDLDNDHDFSDEKPVTKDDPLVYRDMDGDGWPDISGGALHYIADGTTPLPGSYIFGELAPPPPAYSVVMFTGSLENGQDHGTLCASNIVGQGRLPVADDINLRFADLPGDRKPPAAVMGAAPAAKIVAVSNIYRGPQAVIDAAWQYALLGHEPALEGDNVQISSNSYGYSDIDNDGWDEHSRYLERLIRRYNPSHSFVVATGNGGPGFGTATTPAPATGVHVGASSQMGSTGWDSITYTRQIVYGDIAPFSNRGPGAIGSSGVHVAANGSRGSGATAINGSADGLHAWGTWGGTSRATPVAAGNLALVYQAFRSAQGRWPTWEEARTILMAGATHRGYDTLTQGAGVVDGGAAALIAGGVDGVYSLPSHWMPGDYRGVKYASFARLLEAGQQDTAQLRLVNPSERPIDVQVSGATLRRVGGYEFEWSSRPVTSETAYNFLAPDYLIPIDRNAVPADTELMIVRATWPMEQFKRDGQPGNPDSRWRMAVYQHTDVDRDGRLWHDRDMDGVVDKVIAPPNVPSPYIEGFRPLVWSGTEIDRYEYMRFDYNLNASNNLQVWVHDPLGRWADGIYIGLQHQVRNSAIPQANFSLRVDFYAHQDWDWLSLGVSSLSVPANGQATLSASMAVPDRTAPGTYEGAIMARYSGPHIGGRTLVIPVSVSVAAEYDMRGALTLGGPQASDRDAVYDNSVLRGGFDWGWRAESGDWRSFFFDVSVPAQPGTSLVTRNTWGDRNQVSDIDTHILAPLSDRFSDPTHPANGEEDWSDPQWYGPYTLEPVASSTNTYLGSGRWRFDTATGMTDEWVAAPSAAGLHQMLLHNVMVSGDHFDVPFTATLSSASISPTRLSIAGRGSAEITFRSGFDLPGLLVQAFGMAAPIVEPAAEIAQDDPDDQATASYRRAISVTNASRLSIEVAGRPQDDIDLVVLFDANADGAFTHPGEVITTSATEASDERVDIVRPQDGAYAVWVHGYSVAGGGGTFSLRVEYPHGDDLTVTRAPAGPVTAGQTTAILFEYDLSDRQAGGLLGEILVGPPAVPSLLSVRVTSGGSIFLPVLRASR